MQLPTQSFPIDRHHRNGLSNIQLSGITPSTRLYKGYTNQHCAGGADANFNGVVGNPCNGIGVGGQPIVAYKRQNVFGVYGDNDCYACPQLKKQAINNALGQALPFYN